MTEIHHIASSHAPRAAKIARRLPTSCPVTPPPAACAHHDSVLTDWCRLRTIVDALLRRGAASRDDATAIVALNTTPEEPERING